MYRFLLTRRWIGFAVFVIALSALCVRLGFWQWHRMEHKQHLESLVRTHLSAAPVPLSRLSRPGIPIAEDDEWTRVRVSGRFDRAHQVTVKFTTRDGAAGADVVAPLVLPDGMAILVNRGWMPTANVAERPTNVPAPPSGHVAIEGWLRPDNGADRNAVVPFDGQVRAIASHGMQKFVGRALLPGFINLQQPRASHLQAEPRPSISHALNFFYALQWWFFAGLTLLGYFWFARAEARENQGGAGQASATKSA